MADSLITKKAIADSLKELTKTKSFDKISVKDITNRCGINRQTFYYHFEDKYILLKWIYENELLDKYMKDVSFENWNTQLKNLLEDMMEDKAFYKNTISHSENYILQYLLVQAQNIFKQAIDVIDESRPVENDFQYEITDSQRNFIARFFAYGCCGTVIEWVISDMQESPSYIVSNMETLKNLCEKAAYDYLSDNLNID